MQASAQAPVDPIVPAPAASVTDLLRRVRSPEQSRPALTASADPTCGDIPRRGSVEPVIRLRLPRPSVSANTRDVRNNLDLCEVDL